MKVLVVIVSTLLLAQAFAQQTPPGDVLECIGSVVAEAERSDSEDMRLWAADVRDTTQRLRAQRQRCDDLPRDGEFEKCFCFMKNVFVHKTAFQIHQLLFKNVRFSYV